MIYNESIVYPQKIRRHERQRHIDHEVLTFVDPPPLGNDIRNYPNSLFGNLSDNPAISITPREYYKH